MLNKKKLNNYFLFKLKKNYLKFEIKKLLLKSIIYNQQTQPVVRAYASLKLERLHHQTSLSKQYNTCLLTGKNSSIINKYKLARQITKKFGLENKLQNTKVKSW
jgi:ribosomal protein S14